MLKLTVLCIEIMNAPNVTNRQLLDVIKTYWAWRTLWISSTVCFALLGLVYVLFFKADVWVASQGLIVRDEANGAVMRLGRFQSQTEMKTAQETILEMARNSQVLSMALHKTGRPPSLLQMLEAGAPPTSAEVDELAKCIEVRAPRGAELGTTEVIYLDVKQPSRTRAVELNTAVCNALEDQLQTVRKARADGVISELTTATHAAEKSLAEATERLQVIESEAGADLADLRGLTDTNTGGNTNRQVLDTIKSEQRQVELQRHQLEIDLNLAKQSFEDPDALLLTPSRLITNLAGLRKLREGLADASITTAGLKGRFTEVNPIVIAAVETENRIRAQLRQEIGLAIETLTKDLEVTDQQLLKLQSQQSQLEKRLEKLAEIRAQYSNVASDVRSRNQHLQDIQRELAQATASRDAAITSSLLTRLDEPLLGERPIGPGRSLILAGATASGLFFGLGIVFLLTPLTNYTNYGRRQQDNRRSEPYRFSEDRRSPANNITASGSNLTESNSNADEVVSPTTATVTPFTPAPRVAVRASDVLGLRGSNPNANPSPKPQGSALPANALPTNATAAPKTPAVNYADLCNQPPTSAQTQLQPRQHPQTAAQSQRQHIAPLNAQTHGLDAATVKGGAAVAVRPATANGTHVFPQKTAENNATERNATQENKVLEGITVKTAQAMIAASLNPTLTGSFPNTAPQQLGTQHACDA